MIAKIAIVASFRHVLSLCWSLLAFPFESILKSFFSVSYNRQYQHGGRTNVRGELDTSATCSGIIERRVIIDFLKI